jgi:hypothetical protein
LRTLNNQFAAARFIWQVASNRVRGFLDLEGRKDMKMKRLQVALALALLAAAALAGTNAGDELEAPGVFAAPAMPWTQGGN